jgi:hypothetical protein
MTFEDVMVMATFDVTDEMNQNITAPQRELMLWQKMDTMRHRSRADPPYDAT